MKSFEKSILQAALDEQGVFVFPSEISAWFWRRRVLEEGRAATVAADRFLSWDRFKEDFAGSLTGRPANRALRLFFASMFLEQVASGDVRIDSFISDPYTWNARSFVPWFSRVLPGLRQLRLAAERAGETVLGPVLGDLVFLESAYGGFLDRNGLYEPSWNPAVVRTGGEGIRYIICFPEIIEDYPEYAKALENPAFSTLSAGEAGSPRVYRFGTTLEEMDWVLSAVAGYLEGGTRPGDIIITLPDGDEWRYLEEEARLYGVPLDMRIGKPLNGYRAAVFFEILAEIRDGTIDLSVLERLFLDNSYPWKEREAGQELVRFGRSRGILKDDGKRNLWRKKLRAAGRDDLLTYLEALTGGIRGLTGAASFSDLRAGVYAFIDRFLEGDGWSDKDRQVFRYTLDSLGDLVRIENLLVEKPDLRPFSLWLSYLTGSVYVPREAEAGVRVFPYGVTAGIAPRVHFIVGADQVRIRMLKGLPGFLREDQRIACGLADRDFTEEFLSLYTLSGRDVSISFSVQGFDGPGLAPSFFLDHPGSGAVLDPPSGLRGPHYRDPAYWTGEAELPEILPSCLRDGLARIAGTAFKAASGSFDFSEKPDIVENLAAKKTDDQGDMVISPTSLDNFLACRFSFLLSDVLRLEDVESAVSIPDPRERGMFLHEVLKLFMENLRRREEAFFSEKTGEYLRLCREIIGQTGRAWERQGRDFFGPAWRVHLRWTEERCEAFLAAEGEGFSGYMPRFLEESRQRRLEDLPVVLAGRVDRLSVSETAAVLVDYKTNLWYRKSEFSADNAPSFQLPFYAWVVEGDNPPLGCAAYYDISRGTYSRLYEADGQGWLTEDEFFALRASVPSRAAEMAGAVGRGDYSFGSGEACEGCPFRMVCRTRFNVRLPEDQHTGGTP